MREVFQRSMIQIAFPFHLQRFFFSFPDAPTDFGGAANDGLEILSKQRRSAHIGSRFPGDITPPTSAGMDVRSENWCQQNCKMTSCWLGVALLKQNDETIAFLSPTVFSMFFYRLFCPSAGVAGLTHLGSPPSPAPRSRLTCSVDVDGPGRLLGLQINESQTSHRFCVLKENRLRTPAEEGDLQPLSEVTFWPAGFKGFEPIACLSPSPMAFASAVLFSVFRI